ncbi:MAG: rhombosortase [Pseudomonadota bacterium]
MNSSDSQAIPTWRQYWPVGALLIVIVVLGGAGDSVADALAYQRQALGQAQWWRILTGHIVHLNGVHTAMNVLAAGLLVMIFRDAVSPVEWLVAFFLVAVSVSLALYVLHPGLTRYVGASGVIHGLAAFSAIRALPTMRFESCVLLIGMMLKLGSESLRGAAASTEALIGGRVITEAHLYGAFSGVVIGLCWAIFLRRRASRPAA